MNKSKEVLVDLETVIGLDVSTKTIGISVFKFNEPKLLELTHVSPKIKSTVDEDTMFEKADQFKNFILSKKSEWGKVKKIVIEEPLLSSNNVYTVGKLVRFNGMISKIIWDIFQVKPSYISTYNSRKLAFPELMSLNKSGKKVLFGSYPENIDKKEVIFNLVADKEPQIVWLYTKNKALKKECFDMTDAYTVCLAAMKSEGYW